MAANPIKYHGGKYYLAPWIISHMPPRAKNPNDPAKSDPGWVHYAETHFGGGAVLFAQDPEGISEVVNDLNGRLMNFWGVMKDADAFGCMHTALKATPLCKQAFDRALRWEAGCDDPDWQHALQFFIQYRMSRQGLGKDFATMSRNRTRRGMNEQASAFIGAVDDLPVAHQRLRRVVMYCQDANLFINEQDGKRTLFYLDPTYLDETRTAKKAYGKYEMDRDAHIKLLDTLSDIEGRFLLSGYPSKLYDDYAKKNKWRCVRKRIDNKASSAAVKEVKTECLWMNY